MLVNVYHHDFPTRPDALTLVARLNLLDGLDVWPALDFAWRHTQNIDGSWSRGPEIGGRPNGDYRPEIERVAPLPIHEGKTYGLRSSMVGDVFEIDGRRFRVAAIGFAEIAA